MENFSKPSIANFGRSLFGGYCPTNVPDFVLQGMPNDDKLRQGLVSELAHAVQVRDCFIPEALKFVLKLDYESLCLLEAHKASTGVHCCIWSASVGAQNFLFFFLQHPVLDEPIAEAVCIIADTDKWTVQVASSQRRATDNNKLGKEVLVSSLVSSLLQSTHQLYKMNVSPNFVSSYKCQISMQFLAV